MAKLSSSRPGTRPRARPPVRDGIGASSHRLPPGHWPSLLDYLAERFPGVGRDAWYQRLAEGGIYAEDGHVFTPESPYIADIRIFYYREVTEEPTVPDEVQVIYRDEHLLVADKPHFLSVSPVGRFVRETLLTRLRLQLGLDDLVPLHRIDRETAGLVLCSVNPASRDAYTALFRERRIEKVYEAVAASRPALTFPLRRTSRIEVGEPFFTRREADGPENAETLIDVLRTAGEHTLYQATPVTGRTHQIRVHFHALGMPLLNDRLYPRVLECDDADFTAPLQLLARRLRFLDPLDGRERCFESRRQLMLTA